MNNKKESRERKKINKTIEKIEKNNNVKIFIFVIIFVLIISSILYCIFKNRKPDVSNNKYNYIRFRCTEEVNKFMPLEFSVNPDTLIRVIMDYKPLNEKINIKEQELEKTIRNGFTVVEWGGRKIN